MTETKTKTKQCDATTKAGSRCTRAGSIKVGRKRYCKTHGDAGHVQFENQHIRARVPTANTPRRAIKRQETKSVPPVGEPNNTVPITAAHDIQSCQLIRELQAKRIATIKMQRAINQQCLSIVRRFLGWHGSEDDDRAKINAASLAVIKAMEKGVPVPDGLEDVAVNVAPFIAGAKSSRVTFDAMRKNIEKQMTELAESLPVWSAFGMEIRGFGPMSLAIIVGEAGDVGSYKSPSALWKRMGLAVLDGTRQGGLKRGSAAEDWIRHGYSPVRRSAIWTIGDSLLKGNRGGYYREVYDGRKAYEAERAASEGKQVLPAGKITAKNRDKAISQGHVHRRAQRYMEKRLLRKLWQAWRDCYR